MKKFASALAVAAALGVPAVASAQNVTLTPYLTADVGVAYTTHGEEIFGGAEDFDYQDSTLVSSVYGLRGSVDLGNGLKVIGNLEGDFNTATGDRHPAGMFRRAANVGVEGAFGRIEVGTKLNPLLAFNGGSFAMGGNSVATNTAAIMGYGQFFTDESITYTIRTGGLTAQLQYGFDDDSTSTPYGLARERMIAGFVKYDVGPFSIGAAVADTKANDATGLNPMNNRDQTPWIIGIGYKIGGLELKAAYIDNDDADVFAGTVDIDDLATGGNPIDNTAWHIGASYAISPQLKVGGDYVLHDSDSFLLNLQARYTVAKNLMVYGMVNHVDNEDGGATFALLHSGGYGVGSTTGGTSSQRFALAGESETSVAVGMVVSF